MKYICVALLVLILSACKGGDNDPQLTGQFVGEPIVGLSYACGNGPNATSGITNDQGEFLYRASQACVFSVGNVSLGAPTAIPCNGKIVTQDIARVVRSATAAPSVLNIAQFLQSLDNGSLAGKLFIASAHRASLANAPTMVLTTGYSTVSQNELLNSLTLAGKAMVSPAQARSVLDRQIASGAVDLSCGAIKPGSPAVLNSIEVRSSAIPPD